MDLKDEVIRVLRRLDSMPAEEIYKKVKEWAGRKAELSDILSLINLWYRDVLVMKSTGGSGRLVFREEEKDLSAQAEQMSYARIEECIQAIETTRQRMSANVNLEVSLEMLLYTMKG